MLTLNILTPDQNLCIDMCKYITIPAAQGEAQILKMHLNFFAMLKEGIITVHLMDKKKFRDKVEKFNITIHAGVVEITNGTQINILTDNCTIK